ncbi:hypothetical protein OIV83_000150 [Microbotryomycetes sp. JL201]|nr:hypothetical protein OIV83_000150 [Microbotryomycetes sp. JL201]
MPPGRHFAAQQARVVASDDEDDHEALQLPKYGDVNSRYLNQPIDNVPGVATLKSGITDWQIAINELEKARDALYEVAGDISSVLADPNADETALQGGAVPDDPEEIKRIDNEYRTLLDSIAQAKIMSKSLSETRTRLQQSHVINDIWTAYKDPSTLALDEYRKKTSRQKYLDNAEYRSFRALIWENLHEGYMVPDVRKFLPREEGDEEDDDDEVEVGGQIHDFRCPLTLQILQDPYTSKKCPHSFSGHAIREVLRHGPQACPVAACDKVLTLSDIEQDKALSRRVQAHLRRLEQEKASGNTATQRGGRTATQYETISDDEKD